MYYKQAPIPDASDVIFTGGILHPDLWLWDSWVLGGAAGTFNLYCLALSRTNFDGSAITPPERNDYQFHFRHFSTSDDGATWKDRGCLLEPGTVKDGADARNVWSGSVLKLRDDKIAFGYTGIRDCGTERPFLQTICVATGSQPNSVSEFPEEALSCPERDYEEIIGAGYYLGAKTDLGSRKGEDGGPIMGWRDPYLFRTFEGELHAVWSAKLAPTVPAVAHAVLGEADGQITLKKLLPPITLPDSHKMTQAEVPKVYRSNVTGDYFLLVSACDRLYEGQPDGELTHIHRLYRSASMQGPWQTIQPNGSALPGLDYLFGASFLETDFASGQLTVIGPHTEAALPELRLSFAPVKTISVASAECSSASTTHA